MKISVNDFVVMAVAAAFADVPEANVTWSEEGLMAHGSVDVSIAVATDGGLVTPVLRGVEAKRLSGIAREARALAAAGPRAPAAAARARGRHVRGLQPRHVRDAGVLRDHQPAAVRHPRGRRRRPQPVVVDGAVTVATVMRCMLSVDHRAIDGALAARWLSAFTARMQNPMGMIV